MRKMFLTIVGWVAAGTAPALAVDLPPRGSAGSAGAPATAITAATVYDWSGYYLGLDAGAASSRECLTAAAGIAVFPNAQNCRHATGSLAGGQFGARWQSGGWVLGIEGHADWARLNGSNLSLALTPTTDQNGIDAIGLLTGQIGYAVSHVLLYVKGGAAVTANKNSQFAAGGIVVNETSDTRWGGAVGTGVEIGLTPDWSVAAEFDHLFIGQPGATAPSSTSLGQGVDIGTVRVNYHFDGIGRPKS